MQAMISPSPKSRKAQRAIRDAGRKPPSNFNLWAFVRERDQQGHPMKAIRIVPLSDDPPAQSWTRNDPHALTKCRSIFVGIKAITECRCNVAPDLNIRGHRHA